MTLGRCGNFNSIQFNSKTLFKDGDRVKFTTYLPWDDPNM